MKAIVNLSDVPVLERTHARAGLFRSQSLLSGQEGTPENFYLQLSQTYSDFASPRHRHNFDQVRVQLKSDADFARDGVMRPGTIAYFPEGVFYGPQSISGESATLVLQFGGASGSGYISEERFQAGVIELRQHGTFEGGIYHRAKEEGGRKNQDAYEAVWEHIHGQRLAYPKSDYAQPVFLDPADFPWDDEPGQPGVRRRHLGRFSARGMRLSLLGVAAGHSALLAPHSLVFVLQGAGQAAQGAWQQHATLQTGESAETVGAAQDCELLEIHIPPLAH
ncbi:hypothetical protein [Variovorax terrae]|uniref:Uncharacterized protein n=1 Tax=Variovorax terrae TaxID=2923278 RepID=A0A9X2ALY8_9BURK|nr:hypothetical protein [Variovorax terrae]MCJ0762170.1 hypothetical protein [Variovorax terrae]